MNLFENGERNRSTLEASVASHHHHSSFLIFSLQSSSLSLSIFPPPPSLPPSHPSSVVSQPSLSHTATRCTSGKISSPARTTEEASAALQPGPTPPQLETSTSPETPPTDQLLAPGRRRRTARPCPLCPAPTVARTELASAARSLAPTSPETPPPTSCQHLAGAGEPPTLSLVSCARPVARTELASAACSPDPETPLSLPATPGRDRRSCAALIGSRLPALPPVSCTRHGVLTRQTFVSFL